MSRYARRVLSGALGGCIFTILDLFVECAQMTANAGRVPAALASLLQFAAKGNPAAAMEVFAKHKSELSVDHITNAIYALEARQTMGIAFKKHQHCLVPTLKEMSDVLAESRLEAAKEMARYVEETGRVQDSARQQVALTTALMHVSTTCGYHPTKQVLGTYADLKTRGLQPNLSTCLVTARALLLLKQHGKLEAFVSHLRRQTPNLPLPFIHLLIDMYNERQAYKDAHDLFNATVTQYKAATPYLFDAHVRTCVAVGAPRRYLARLQARMYQLLILPHEVAPVTWQVLQDAVDAEHLEAEQAFATSNTVAAKLKKGGVFQPIDFEDLLTPELKTKLKTGNYETEQPTFSK